MERFLERLSISKYKDYFVIKGGILVTSMVGVSMRSTMDIDTTIKNWIITNEKSKHIMPLTKKYQIIRKQWKKHSFNI